MNAYEILELMWAGYIAICQESRLDAGLPYGELDLSNAEAEEWLDAILNKGSRLSSYLDDGGFYQPCLN
jgi:hypothetical protein